ncbi:MULTISPECIES: RAMP superfamily CRISPR-associated protein [Nostocales]|uniref:RAMP superfamily CRISPR-associated protein n=2 Tax=Nostocales TaxID=1161 RepID=A0ABW8WV73_9CYAN
MNDENVPMMFRAQVGGRCQIQRVVDKRKNTTKDKRQDVEIWVDEWKDVFPKDLLPQEESQKHQAVSNSQQDNNQAVARPKPNAKPPESTTFKFPEFGSNVKTWTYSIKWRLVSNSGQDEGVIRPIIGAKGFPYFSGASMKGAFIRACKQFYGKEQGKKEAEKYCGKKLADGSSEPGILRFHGAYPVNMNWTKSLVDIIHSQEIKQVIKDDRNKPTNANSMISLYKTTLRFGISSTIELDESEWNILKIIWERALACGLGSRVSASYGYFRSLEINQSHHPNQLLQVKLKGQGAISKLVNRTPEFRPNMFKAALRGHTLRLLGGLTDEGTAKQITQKLWGGFADKNLDKDSTGSIVGLLGIDFDFEPSQIISQNNPGHYELSEGILNIFCMHPEIESAEKEKLLRTADTLIKFSMLFGGFGKSWRRVCHKEFYREYFNNHSDKVIGCHWQFLDKLAYYPVNQLEDIIGYIKDIREIICSWIPQHKRVNRDVTTVLKTPMSTPIKTTTSPSINLSNQSQSPHLKPPPKRPDNLPKNQPHNQVDQNSDIVHWREAWYSPKVQVWARFAENGESKAILWFHDAYRGEDTIKKSLLAGSMGNTGRIWHRMYPRFVINDNKEIVRGDGYVELLTIFSDESSETTKFLNFLKDNSGFTKIW